MSNEKTYWASLGELNQTPEFLETVGKEFPAPPEEQNITAMERRSFLKLMGAGMLLASASGCRRPVEKIIPYVNKPVEVTPGVANWYTTTCGECSASCGVLAKSREGRPIKLEGNPSHPLSQGGLCGRGQASILNLYNPDRLKNPVIPSLLGSYQDTDWSHVDSQIKEQLFKVKQSGKKVVVLSGTLTSPSTKKLIQEFLGNFPGGKHVVYDPVVPEEISLAQELSYGTKLTPHYHFDRAQVIVSFGADFLGTWLSPVEFAKDFSKGRRVQTGKMSRLIVIEPALTLTGMNADEHHAVKAGNELAVALALAHEMIVRRKLSTEASNGDIVRALSNYSINNVATSTGIPAEKLREIANNLWNNRGRSLVVGGNVKGKNSVALQVAVNLLNSVLENERVTVDGSHPSSQSDSSFADLLNLVEDLRQRNVGALLIYKSNPVYTFPSPLTTDQDTLGDTLLEGDSGTFANLIKKVPLTVSFADRLDETAKLCNFVTPDSHYLESWNDNEPVKGVVTITQPLISPLSSTRPFQDSLLTWNSSALTWHDYLQSNFSGDWNQSLQQGFTQTTNSNGGGSRNFQSSSLSALPNRNTATSNEVTLSLYPSVALYDGRSADNGWLQELPDPITKITWGNYLSVSPKKASALHLQDGDVVKLTLTSGNSIEIPALVQPMLGEDVVMSAIGYGRSGIGHVGSDVGINTLPLQTQKGNYVEWGGLGVASIAKTGVKERLAVTQGHHTIEGRPIIKETTFDELKKNSKAGNEESEVLQSMWPTFDYKGYRWGMAIDMNSCIGCSACMIGCQSENNIPVVGKTQVINGREMHWLRIDRYYSGTANEAEANFQPMLCQQCENAPCETVCPVLATFHNDEGLNMQSYNRCVGTRYCSNNCPYKVRRFNFFNYTKNIVAPQNLVLNPDITTRSRGVMEKCTFCLQRIADGKGTAKDEGRLVRDGDIKTACQQSCPTDAIVFGNINDPESLVSQLKRSPRGYHVLEDLNVKPQVTYLLKVRNKDA